MVGKEDTSSSWGAYQVPDNKKFWRSASWSSSRTAAHCAEGEDKNGVDLNGIPGNNGALPRRFPAPLTPRSQHSSKARSCLPPLQPLAIARRSLDEWPKAGSDDIGEWPGPPTPGGRDVNKGSERLKLDMSCIQSSDKNGGLVKRDKIAFFDKECSKVADHIYLGGDSVAKDRELLKKNGITHVLNCVGFVCPEYFKSDFVYRTLWLQDSPTEDITSILYDVFDYFEDVREQKGRVFVHCCQGVSRSTSLVIAYLMWREGQSFDDAFQYVKEARGIADPNMGFACQLLQCQKRVHAVPLSPSSLLRVYRIAPHSPYDPLHLVPKMLNDPSPSALDSRGAFIIQVPCAICVWVGKHSDFIMEREARGAVTQIVRYEKVQVPVYVINEGEEPSFFWDIFSDYVMEKSSNGVKRHGDSSPEIQPGDRKVNLYDLDFEIFQKAIKGGFVPPVSTSETELETQLPARENSWSLLRRKFASGHMKEFVSAPKLFINRLCSDSRANNGTLVSSFTSSSPSSLCSSSSSSSSSSPPYLSPDSISSDSSNSSRSSQESPLESPLSLSSTLSRFSNMSLLSSKPSANVTSNHSDYIEVNFASHPMKSAATPLRRPLISIAERRGSLSKFLKLPIVPGDGRVQETSQNYSVDQQGDANVNDMSCISFELEKGGFIVGSKKAANNIDLDSENFARNLDSCCEESASTSVCDKMSDKDNLSVISNPYSIAGVSPTDSTNCEHKQPYVYRLPNLERMSITGACDLDSSSAFVVVPPKTVADASENSIIYVRIGKSFTFEESHDCTNTELGDTDWNQVGSDVLSRLGLAEDSELKIIKEGHEPPDLLDLLSTL